MLIPYAVDVPFDYRPVVNWILVMSIILAFVLMVVSEEEGIEPWVLRDWDLQGLFGHMWLHGGLLHIAYKARCDSGHFDICVFHSGSIFSLAKFGFTAYHGRIAESSGLTYLTGRHIEITADAPAPVEVDGDYHGTTPLTIDIVPAAVPILKERPAP